MTICRRGRSWLQVSGRTSARSSTAPPEPPPRACANPRRSAGSSPGRRAQRGRSPEAVHGRASFVIRAIGLPARQARPDCGRTPEAGIRLLALRSGAASPAGDQTGPGPERLNGNSISKGAFDGGRKPPPGPGGVASKGDEQRIEGPHQRSDTPPGWDGNQAENSNGRTGRAEHLPRQPRRLLVGRGPSPTSRQALESVRRAPPAAAGTAGRRGHGPAPGWHRG